MIPALAQANEQIDVAEMGRAAIFTSNLERSTRFYARLFSFRVVDYGHAAPVPHVVMTADGEATLSIRAHGNAEARPARLTMRVANLDAAREALWNQGVVPTIDCTTATHHADRYVVITDPDGHEIALVEQLTGRRPATLRHVA